MRKKIIRMLIILVVLIQLMAIFHAYRFTHFQTTHHGKTKLENMNSTLSRLAVLVFGVNNPRPENTTRPTMPFQTVFVGEERELETWMLNQESTRGTVIMFHGYGGNKSGMVEKGTFFAKNGYRVMLVDFMGSGGSKGNQTTIGYKEANQVTRCFHYIRHYYEGDVFLMGNSMGAAAILRAIAVDTIQPDKIILESTFATLQTAVNARFRKMNLPTIPLSQILVFWGGIENGFWGFNHQPYRYAKKVHCPTLVIYGLEDERVTPHETDQILDNLKDERYLPLKETGHNVNLSECKNTWEKEVQRFLSGN